MERELIVVGGGLVGLAAAWHASRLGVGVTVLERSAELGGRWAGVDWGGRRVDALAHRVPASALPVLWPDRTVPGLASLRPVGVSERVLVDGRWARVPLRARPVLAERVAEGLGLKLWGLPAVALEPGAFDAGLAALGLVDPLRPPRGSQPSLAWWRLNRGLVGLVESLATELAQAGVELRRSCSVDGVRPEAGGVHVHVGDGSIITARQVVLAVPLRAALELLPEVPAPVRNAVAAQRWRSVVSVLFEVPGPCARHLDGCWFADCDTPLVRLAVAAPSAPGESELVSAELVVTRDDPLWLADDDELVWLVQHLLASRGLPQVGLAPALVPPRVHRLADLLPVPRSAHVQHRAVVDEWLAGLPRVAVAPDPPWFPHLAPHRLLAAGRELAAVAQRSASSAIACAASQTST